MFKAKLIDNPDFYRIRQKLIWIGFPTSILIGIIGAFIVEGNSIWIAMGVLGLIIAFIWEVRAQKSFAKLDNGSVISISNSVLELKTSTDEIFERIPLEKATEVVVKSTYQIYGEKLIDIWKEMIGRPQVSFIELHIDQHYHRFEFLVDSYYMLEQLKKSIAASKANGIQVREKN